MWQCIPARVFVVHVRHPLLAIQGGNAVKDFETPGVDRQVNPLLTCLGHCVHPSHCTTVTVATGIRSINKREATVMQKDACKLFGNPVVDNGSVGLFRTEQPIVRVFSGKERPSRGMSSAVGNAGCERE